MKIKDTDKKKRVVNRLRRVEGQLRGVVQMIEDEVTVHDIVQQISAIRSALTQALYEEFFCVLERMNEKRDGLLFDKDIDELRMLLKGIK